MDEDCVAALWSEPDEFTSQLCPDSLALRPLTWKTNVKSSSVFLKLQ